MKIEGGPEFAEQILSWVETSGFKFVMTCLHEGTHVLYKRESGFDPEMYGPHYILIGGVYKYALGSVEGTPREILLAAEPMLIAKSYLGSAYIEEIVRGKQDWETIWRSSKGDLTNYNNWRVLRHNVVGDIGKQSLEAIRDSVRDDFSDPRFRQRLMDCAREYERRVFGTQINSEIEVRNSR